jgi:hypothetical protein
VFPRDKNLSALKFSDQSAVDAAFPQATLNRLKGKVDVLNAAMHVGVDNLHLKLFFKGLGACFCLVRISAG